MIKIGCNVVQALKDSYTIVIPEKFNCQTGMNYVTDPDMIAIYFLRYTDAENEVPRNPVVPERPPKIRNEEL